MADSNWIATLSPVIHLGLKPVFVDVKLDNWCIDPDKIKKKLTKKLFNYCNPSLWKCL